MKHARYRLVFDNHQTTLQRVPEGEQVLANGVDTFSNFTPAKKALMRYLKGQRDLYAGAVREARILDKWQLERPSGSQLQLGVL